MQKIAVAPRAAAWIETIYLRISFYRAMGEAFKKQCRGWTAYVLSGNPEATRHIDLKASRRLPLRNGPIDCRLLKYELY